MYHRSYTLYFFPVMLSVENISASVLGYTMNSSIPLISKSNAAKISVANTNHAVAAVETFWNNDTGGIACHTGKLKIAILEGAYVLGRATLPRIIEGPKPLCGCVRAPVKLWRIDDRQCE